MRTKHTIRKAPHGGTIEVELTRTTAIKAFCTECLGYETHPRKCEATLCPLYPFRGKTTLAFGRERSPAQVAAAEELAKLTRTSETPEDRAQDAIR